MSLPSSSSPWAAADCVAGSGSVLLGSCWVPADPRYSNESGSAVLWPAGSQGPLEGVLRSRFLFSGVMLDVQQHEEDGIKHPRTEPCWGVQHAGNWGDKELLSWRCWGCLALNTAPSCHGGGEDRGSLGYGREWLCCKLNVPDEIPSSGLWSLGIRSRFSIIQINPICCFSSWCACFFPCGSQDSHKGTGLAWRHVVLQRGPGASAECCRVQTPFKSKRSLWLALFHSSVTVGLLRVKLKALGSSRMLGCWCAGLCGMPLPPPLCRSCKAWRHRTI